MNPRGRPQRKQRFRWRQRSFGLRAAAAFSNLSSRAIFAVVAITVNLCSLLYCRNGIPINRNSDMASASVDAVVVMQIFIPFVLSTLL